MMNDQEESFDHVPIGEWLKTGIRFLRDALTGRSLQPHKLCVNGKVQSTHRTVQGALNACPPILYNDVVIQVGPDCDETLR